MYSGWGGGKQILDEINNYKRPNVLTALLERTNTGYVNNAEMMRVSGVQNG